MILRQLLASGKIESVHACDRGMFDNSEELDEDEDTGQARDSSRRVLTARNRSTTFSNSHPSVDSGMEVLPSGRVVTDKLHMCEVALLSGLHRLLSVTDILYIRIAVLFSIKSTYKVKPSVIRKSASTVGLDLQNNFMRGDDELSETTEVGDNGSHTRGLKELPKLNCWA